MNNRKKHISSILIHIGFWLLSFLVLYRIFTANYDSGKSDVIYTILFHLPLLLVVYGNVLLHSYFSNRSFWIFLVAWIGLSALGVAFYFLIFELLVDYFTSGYYFISYYSPLEILQFVLAYLVISTLLLLSAKQFRLQREKVMLQRENQAVKLRSLRAQVNPHFLINSLNNIYAMTKAEDGETRDYLIKVSDSLRYMIYETDSDKVLLADEMKYIRDYIDLEKLRVEEQAQIEFVQEGEFEGYLIAPLLLIPCVENCFKHFDKADGHISIHIRNREGRLHLFTKNNFDRMQKHTAGGMGLKNVKKRLELLYPGKHLFETSSDDGIYTSRLEIDLS